MFEQFKIWWRKKRCQHYYITTETWLVNETCPMVERKTVCNDCGVLISPGVGPNPDMLYKLLDRAKRLPVGTRHLMKS